MPLTIGTIEDILSDLVHMTQKVAFAVRLSTTALLEAELHLAEQVIGDDAELDRMYTDIEERVFTLLARQAPVVGERGPWLPRSESSRTWSGWATLGPHRQDRPIALPRVAVPDLLRPTFVAMGDIAETMVNIAAETLDSRSVERAKELGARDEEMDDLRLSLFPGNAW